MSGGPPSAPVAATVELRALETAIARRDWTPFGGIDGLLDPDFFEFGSSGRLWDRAAIVESLSDSGPSDVAIDDFVVRRLADDVYLATFRTTHPQPGSAPRRCVRSSIWTLRDGRWRLRFHQGTLVAPTGG